MGSNTGGGRATGADRRGRRLLRLLGPVAFVAGSIAWVGIGGIPTSRELIAAWVLIGLLAFMGGDVRGWARGVVFDFLPFFGLLLVYDLLRGGADGLFFGAHYMPQIDADRALFGTAPTVTLQHWLYHPGRVMPWDVGLWAVYITHFFATPILAGVFWKIDRERFRTFTATVVTLAMAGFVTYALFPAAPPWLAAQKGHLEHVVRIIPQIWDQLSVTSAHKVIERGYRFANDVAAIPSLHAAFSLMVALFLWPRRRWLRVLVALYPIAMGFALVYSAEHYVVDVLIGWAYAGGAVMAVRALAARRFVLRPTAEPAPAMAAE
jgi:membrane-associated phospholipid phosphatase